MEYLKIEGGIIPPLGLSHALLFCVPYKAATSGTPEEKQEQDDKPQNCVIPKQTT